jgi:hypothetical protein
MSKETLWRVIFTNETRLQLPAAAAGPWQPHRNVVAKWVEWFNETSGFARMQNSHGEIWEGSIRIYVPPPKKS